MTSAPITVAQLDATARAACTCDDPNCGVTITAYCHPHAGTRVKYFKLTGHLQICCAQCEGLISTIVLAAQA